MVATTNDQTLKVGQSTNADTSTLKESKAATENIAPIALNVDANMMSVVPGDYLDQQRCQVLH